MNNIFYFLLGFLNYKGCYSQSHGKNHKMTGIAILVDNFGGKNKNTVTIHFLNMIKEGGFFGTDTFHLYIKRHTNNDCGHSFDSLKLMYKEKMSLRIAVNILTLAIMLKIFKCSMKKSLTCNNY